MDGNECTLPDPGDIGQLSMTSVRPCMRWAAPAGGGGDDPGVGAEWEGRRARGGGGGSGYCGSTWMAEMRTQSTRKSRSRGESGRIIRREPWFSLQLQTCSLKRGPPRSWINVSPTPETLAQRLVRAGLHPSALPGAVCRKTDLDK